MAINKEDVQQILDLVRPSLQADGGDCSLVEIRDDGTVILELEGHCKGCPMSQYTLSQGIERVLKENIPDVKQVLSVDLADMIETA